MLVHVTQLDIDTTGTSSGPDLCVTGTDESGQRVTIQTTRASVPGYVEAIDVIRAWDEVPDTEDD